MSDASVGLAVVRSSDREVVAICGGSFGPRPTERSLHFLAVIWASPDREVVAFSCTYSGKVGGGEKASVGLGLSGLEAATPGLHERPPKKCPRRYRQRGC